MLPPTEQPTICFAHVAYRLRERFLALATGIESFEVSDGAAPRAADRRGRRAGDLEALAQRSLAARDAR